MAKCKGCGREIIWHETPAGKSMPVDPEPVLYWPRTRGSGKVMNLKGAIVSCTFDGPMTEPGEYGYVPHWVSVEERKPPEYTDVWCAVYTTDLIYVEDGETVEEAIENRQREAARNPRVTLGSYSEDEGWTDGYFGMPMVCQPWYWLEMTFPELPREVQDGQA